MHTHRCVLIEISMEIRMLNFWLRLLVTALTKETYLVLVTNKIKIQVSSLSNSFSMKTFQQSVIWPNFGALFDALVQKYAGVSATNLQPWCFKGQLWIIIFFILLKTWCLEQRLLYSYLFNVIVKCTHHIFPIWQIRAHCSSLHRDSPYLMAAFIYHKRVYNKYSIHWLYVLIHCISSGLWCVKLKIVDTVMIFWSRSWAEGSCNAKHVC